jgi:hypothetical protein
MIPLHRLERKEGVKSADFRTQDIRVMIFSKQMAASNLRKRRDFTKVVLRRMSKL